MSFAGNAQITYYPDNVPLRWRLRVNEDDGQVQLYGKNDAGAVCYFADPAVVLRELDTARRLLIDHLVDTVGVPAHLVAELGIPSEYDTEPTPAPDDREVSAGTSFPNHMPTGRTTAAALTERMATYDGAVTR